MKYAEFAGIDNYSMKVAGKKYHAVYPEVGRAEVKEAFDFISSFEKSDKFTQSSLKVGKVEALKVLQAFEKECRDAQDAEDKARKEKNKLRVKAIETSAEKFEKELLPAFQNIRKILDDLNKIPEYNSAHLAEKIRKEIRGLGDIANVVLY